MGWYPWCQQSGFGVGVSQTTLKDRVSGRIIPNSYPGRHPYSQVDLGGGGHFRHMPPFFGEMWACPNRKMNMHVECAPPPFGLEVGVVLSKI